MFIPEEDFSKKKKMIYITRVFLESNLGTGHIFPCNDTTST